MAPKYILISMIKGFRGKALYQGMSQLYNTRHHAHLNMPLLCGPEVHTNINDKGIPRESPIPGNVTLPPPQHKRAPKQVKIPKYTLSTLIGNFYKQKKNGARTRTTTRLPGIFTRETSATGLTPIQQSKRNRRINNQTKWLTNVTNVHVPHYIAVW